MIRFLLVLAALLLGACELGPFPKDPTTAPSSWPADPLPPLAAAGASSGCAGAIENSKRLGCPFEGDDAAGWCATRTAKEIACMNRQANCLALRQCTEAKP